MFAAVVLLGVTSAFRTPVAGALVIAWVYGEFVWLLTGDSLPLAAYVLSNAFVIAVIMCHEARDCSPYKTDLAQLIAALWYERYAEDRILLLLFPVLWTLYLAPLEEYYKWWAIYYLVLLRFCIVGAVTVKVMACWLWKRLAASRTPPTGLEFNALLGRAGYG